MKDLNNKLSRAKAFVKEHKEEFIIFGACAAVGTVVGTYASFKITDAQIKAFEEKLASGVALIPMPGKVGSYITIPIKYDPNLTNL